MHQLIKKGNNVILELKINGDTIADHNELAEKFNDYFINIIHISEITGRLD